MFIWPLEDYIITRDFYYKAKLYIGGQHAAIDLIRRTEVTRASPIKAIADGTVAGVGWDFYSGFFVSLDLADGYRCFYRHLYGQSPVVVGQQVSQGQIIGNVGNTGWSLGAHLHFDLWNRNKIRDDKAIFYKNNWYALDPVLYLGQEDVMLTPEEEQEIRHIIAEHKPGGGHYDALHPLFALIEDLVAQHKPDGDHYEALTALFERVDELASLARALDAEHKPGGGHFDALHPLFERIADLENRPTGGTYTDAQAIKAVKDALPN